LVEVERKIGDIGIVVKRKTLLLTGHAIRIKEINPNRVRVFVSVKYK